MTTFGFHILPTISPWLIGLGWLVGMALLIPLLIDRRWLVAGLRALVISLLALTLVQPQIAIEDHKEQSTQVLIFFDVSGSQKATGRLSMTKEAVDGLSDMITNKRGLEVIHHDITSDPTQGGTRLIGALKAAQGTYDEKRLGAAFMVTDGLIEDDPDALSASLEQLNAPSYVLLTRQPEHVDRRIEVNDLPQFVVTKQNINFSATVIDESETGTINEDAAPELRVWLNGEVIWQNPVNIGKKQNFTFTLDRRGDNVIELEVDDLAGEVSTKNNRVSIPMSGVKDRFNVLLVSGNVYPGVRVWRDLLKSDPVIDLVHFTILRSQQSIDATANNELSLIAFPTRELFEQKLPDFDLIIFDRYSYRQILLPHYFDNIVRYVAGGGALMVVVGEEYLKNESLALTPLINVLPALPKVRSTQGLFTPRVTEKGHRHPVSRGIIPSSTNETTQEGVDEPPWGSWFEHIDSIQRAGLTLMTGHNDKPLLILNERGQGRVAMMLSADFWLWARGFEGGGPHRLLMRNLVHWLTKAPELEAERLSANLHDNKLYIELQTLGEDVPSVTIIDDQAYEQTITLTPTDQKGFYRTDMPMDSSRDMTLISDELTARVIPDPIQVVEFARLVPSAEPLKSLIRAKGGHQLDIVMDESGQVDLPSLRMVNENTRTKFADDWLGIVERKTTDVIGVKSVSLFDGWWALVLLLGSLALLWWCESR